MEDYERKFDKNKIHSVELNLLDGQVELILRALDYMVIILNICLTVMMLQMSKNKRKYQC